MTAAVITTVSWGALAFGAVYPWAYWPLMWGAVLTGLLGLSSGPGLLTTLRHPLSLAMLTLTGAVLLQLVPLPSSVLGTVSPATLAFVQDYVQVPEEVVAAATDRAVTAGSTATARPLSLRPRATVVALLLTMSLGLMIVGGSAGLSIRGARYLAASLLVLGLVVAFIAIVRGAPARGPIYGFWEARFIDRAFGPFVNRNHFAGWMVMAISAGLGYVMAISSHAMHGLEGWRSRVLWISSPEASRILLAGVALAVMGLSLALTASRSGIGCFVVALLVVGACALRQRAEIETPRLRRALMVGFVACLAVVTVLWTGLSAMTARFSYASAAPFSLAGRADLWHDALEVVRRYPLTGTGLNTYTVVTPFHQTRAIATSNEAHNDYLQLAAEGGLLVGVPAFGLLVVFVREVHRRFRANTHSLTSFWLRVGAVAGLLAIAVQESVEFSLQLPGNAVMFAALCLVALHTSEGKKP